MYYNVMNGTNHCLGTFENRNAAETFMREELIPDHDCVIVITDEPIVG